MEDDEMKRVFFLVTISVMTTQVVLCQIPKTMSYQGVLTDSQGKVVPDGDYKLTLKLYTSLTAGEALWSEEHRSVSVEKGVFDVILGSINSLDDVAFDKPYWLGVTVNDGRELVPRIALTSAAYSLNAPTISEALFVDNDGNVGIGVTDPTEALDVKGNIHSSGTIRSGNSITINGAPFAGEPDEISASTGSLAILGDPSTADIRVGIGTRNPNFNFHVNYLPQLSISMPPTRLGVQWSAPVVDPQNPVTDWFYFAVGGSGSQFGTGTRLIRKENTNLHFFTQKNIDSGEPTSQMVLNNLGYLGIGTSTPGHMLHINNINNASGGTVRFTNDKGTLLDIGVSGSESGWAVGNNNPYLWTNEKNLIIFPGNGNVGINNPTPQYKLDVNGSVRTTVLEITGGGDLAEPFDINNSQSVEPGMVVGIDPQHPAKLRIVDKAYDKTVAGCVSGANGINPGLIMQQEGTEADGTFPVALSGRVYCWADASYGSIQPGDLLTTSDTPGHMMKVRNYSRAQGAVLGKAMGTLDKGTGLVLVLVCLQ